jgi:predicted nucleic acid-binding protein
MGLPASEQRVLDTIENDLRITDRQLAAAFATFTRFASGTRMPGPERLSAWHRLITRLRSWRIGWPLLTSAGPHSARWAGPHRRLWLLPSEGRPAIISFVTVAELRFGAKLARWGPTRLQQLEHELDQADTVWPGPSLAEAYATLRTWCVKAGHGLGQKAHEADRWVAATAIWLGVPLIAHDAIFANVKDLRLLTKLDQRAP